MAALTKIRQSGFDVTLVDGFIEISPSSKLTPEQRDYLKAHKPEIIAELVGDARSTPIDGELLADTKPPKMQVLEGEGTHLGAFVVHGDTWGHFEDADYRDEPVPELNTYPKHITVWTPAGEPVQVMAKDAAHGQFLITKNPPTVAKTHLNALFTCGLCQHFKPHHAHGKGSGSCSAGVMPSGVCHWSETVTECNQFKQLEATP